MKKARRKPPEVLAKEAEFEARERALGEMGRRHGGGGSERDRDLAGWLGAYAARYGASRRRLSAEKLGRVHRRFLAWAAARGLERVRDATREEALAYAAWLTSSATGAPGLSRSTAEGELSMLGGAWSEAEDEREAGLAHPWRKLAVAGAPPDPDRPSWTWEQYNRLLPACPPWLRRLVATGVHTGLRVGELRALRWGWIEWGDTRYPWGVLRVPASAAKGKRSREIPLHRTAHDLLMPGAGLGGAEGVVLPSARGRAIGGNGDVHKALERSCARAGVTFGATHAMRRSFGRWAVQGVGPWQGTPVPMRIVSQWLGHRDLATTEKYLAIEERVSDAYMNPERRDAGG